MKHPLPSITAQRTGPILAGLVLASWLFSLAAGAGELPATTAEGFAIPQPGREFLFPRDHGSHPEFAVEWWYITGHLTGAGDERFGFQATFFRRALKTSAGTNFPPETAFGHQPQRLGRCVRHRHARRPQRQLVPAPDGYECSRRRGI